MKSFLLIGLFNSLLALSLAAQAAPGKLVSVTHLNDVPAANIQIARGYFCPAEVGNAKAYGFKKYKIDFETVDLKGQSVQSSGLLIVPDTNAAFPVLVYQHGTVGGRMELPSSNPKNAEGDIAGYCYASMGYVSVLADYLGYGDVTGVHPYLHGASEAWVARDMLRASKEALTKLTVTTTSRLFVSGYSQGGHAAMALLKFLEEDPTHEFTVTAAAPMSGPYHLSGAMGSAITNPAPASTTYILFVLMGYNAAYGLFPDLKTVFNEQYIGLAQQMTDGSHKILEIMSRMNMKPWELVRTDYLEDLANNPENGMRKALIANDNYNWTPKTPLRLYAGKADRDVPFQNAQDAYDYMKARGANVELINLGDSVDHIAGIALAFGQSALWFETVRDGN